MNFSMRPLFSICGAMAIMVSLFAADVLANDGSDSSEITAAIVLYEEDKLAEAAVAFETLQEQEPNAEALYYLGRISAQNGDLEAGAELIEEAVELDDTQSVYHQKLGEYYGTLAGEASIFKQMGLAKKSRTNFEQAIVLDPDNLEARSGMLTYYLQAPGIAGGSEEKAESEALEIRQRNPAQGHLAMARVRAHQGNDEAAEVEYRAALKSDPENSETWMTFGIYLTSKERFSEALSVYRERLKAQPDDMSVTYQLGRTVSISGLNLEEGRDAFIRYTSGYQPAPGEPGLDWAHYRLGLIYEQLNEQELAEAQYRMAMDLNPDHPEAKNALKKLK